MGGKAVIKQWRLEREEREGEERKIEREKGKGLGEL